MKKYLIVYGLSFLVQYLSAQSSQNEVRLKDALDSIELHESLIFYYPDEWLSDINVALPSDKSLPIMTFVDSLLTQAGMSYYIEEPHIYLTKNSQIITSLFLSEESEEDKSEVSGVVFEKEYYTNQPGVDEVIEIGYRVKSGVANRAEVSGYIYDPNGAPLEGVFIFRQEPTISAVSESNGYYEISLPKGENRIYFQYAGAKTSYRDIVLFSDGTLNTVLEDEPIALSEVVIESNKGINVESPQMGVSEISVESIKSVPVVLGERDIVKVATTLAGIQTIGEGANGFNVRGGKTDQNLVIMDGATIYNTSHFLGFFSVFNSDVISNLKTFKSSIPARYGGRLSSVMDIELQEAPTEAFGGSGGISPITSKLSLQIPFGKGKSSLSLGGRTTYSDWVLSRVNNDNFKNNNVSFYDVTAKYKWNLDEDNKLTVSGYFSNDNFQLSSDTLFSYQNLAVSVNWDRIVNQVFDFRLGFNVSRYKYQIDYQTIAENSFLFNFDITEYNALWDLNRRIGDHGLNFGIQLKYYRLNPGEILPASDASIVNSMAVDPENGIESSVFLSDEFEVTDRLTFNAGLRYSLYNLMGPSIAYSYDPNQSMTRESISDSTYFKSGEFAKTYHGPEYRLSLNYSLNRLSSLKASLNRTRQYIHALSNSASMSPTDVWKLSDTHVKPQVMDQVSVGYYKNSTNSKYEFSVEAYGKRYRNMLDYKVGAQFILDNEVETSIIQGDGRAYGFEVSLTKSGDLSGWINYVYSRSFNKFDGNYEDEILNDGGYFPSNFDKPHYVNMVANYKLTRRYSLSLNMNYSTGRPVTYPIGKYSFQGTESVYYSDRNQFRLPDYFRVDLGLNVEGNHKIKKLAHSFWTFSVYNITGRDNVYSLFFQVESGEVKGYNVVVFGAPIPTVSYNFKF